jgi:multidrug resistance efflux pump
LIKKSSPRALLLAFAMACAAEASAQVLYKLVDREGRVTYSDREPKNHDGTVTRIEQDTAPTLVPQGATVTAKPAEAAAPGMAESRNKAREALDRQLREAQARVDAARAAKAKGEDPLSEELQTVQHRYAPLREGQAPPRANCFNVVDPNGAASLNCPTQVPQESYYERRKKLDDDLGLAEEELAAAERAYRRGTD